MYAAQTERNEKLSQYLGKLGIMHFKPAKQIERLESGSVRIRGQCFIDSQKSKCEGVFEFIPDDVGDNGSLGRLTIYE